MTTRFDVKTSHGKIAVETKGQGFPVVFIHGNSACRQVFSKQIASPQLDGYHLITFDLSGHGESDDAKHHEQTYTRSGLADLVEELLGELDISRAAIVGASLGGHIAIELLAHSQIPRGLFLMGTPAVGVNMADGFAGNPLNGMGSQSKLSSPEVEKFARVVFGADFEPFMQAAIERTDQKFRSTLFTAARRGVGINQREALAATSIPTAIVNGENDQIINLDYIDTVPYGNLWQQKCFRIPNASHSPFWEAADVVNLQLANFLNDLSDRPYGW